MVLLKLCANSLKFCILVALCAFYEDHINILTIILIQISEYCKMIRFQKKGICKSTFWTTSFKFLYACMALWRKQFVNKNTADCYLDLLSFNLGNNISLVNGFFTLYLRPICFRFFIHLCIFQAFCVNLLILDHSRDVGAGVQTLYNWYRKWITIVEYILCLFGSR